jgi:hypothetical protein
MFKMILRGFRVCKSGPLRRLYELELVERPRVKSQLIRYLSVNPQVSRTGLGLSQVRNPLMFLEVLVTG